VSGRFVAVGDDGFRPRIWGIGDTEAEAIADALAQDGGPTDAQWLFVHPCTRSVEERYQQCDYSWTRSGEPQED
jgi:hypothetical protein